MIDFFPPYFRSRAELPQFYSDEPAPPCRGCYLYRVQKRLWRFVHRECPDLDAAKKFVAQWAQGTHPLSVDRQDIKFDGLHLNATMRAMAALVSMVLEGESWNDGPTNYLETKYGSVLYFEM